MFDPEFYPTSPAAWDAMNVDCYGKVVLDPSAGKGDLLNFARQAGAERTLGIEKHPQLHQLCGKQHEMIGSDWFKASMEDISHVQMIIMNPPFSNADEHVLHAWEIAPEGCEIVAQCNVETINNPWSMRRKELASLIKNNGSFDSFDGAYKAAERTTKVGIAVVRLFKPVSVHNEAFEGFYYDMPELTEMDGIVKYNEIQALVNNYTGAVRCFDRFADVGTELNSICKELNFGSGFGYKVTNDVNGRSESEIIDKHVFARQLQKRCWKIVFSKFDLEKYLTKGVMAKVNDYVESRINYPFTMKNIFRMIETIVGTSGENMERAIVEAVDNFTRHSADNIFNVEGWKTNAGHMLNRKFITPHLCEYTYSFEKTNKLKIDSYRSNFVMITDLVKALCFLTGKDYNRMPPIGDSALPIDLQREIQEMRESDFKKTGKYNRLYIPYPTPAGYERFEPNTWYEWGFFRFKVYRKGTGHFEFLNIEDWARLNQAYGKAKGNPLPQEVWKGFKKRTKAKQAA